MSNHYVQFSDTVHHEMSIRELAEAMTEGQMVHMANHLWKHYGVGAQKLLGVNGRHVTVDDKEYILIPVEG